MNNNNKKVCKRFEKTINSSLITNILNDNNKSIKDIIKPINNINTIIINYLYIYLKLINTDDYILEDLNTFINSINITNNENPNSITSRIIVNRMKKNGLDYNLIKEKCLKELINNRLYVYCNNDNKTINNSNEIINKDLENVYSIFSMYGLEKLFKNKKNTANIYYDGNFNNVMEYCYTYPKWLYLLLGDYYILKDKEKSFKSINKFLRKLDLLSKESMVDSLENIWDYYEINPITPPILLFEGNNVDDRNSIQFNWDDNELEKDNLERLINSIIKMNNMSSNKNMNKESFQKIEFPPLDKICDLNKQKELIMSKNKTIN